MSKVESWTGLGNKPVHMLELWTGTFRPEAISEKSLLSVKVTDSDRPSKPAAPSTKPPVQMNSKKRLRTSRTRGGGGCLSSSRYPLNLRASTRAARDQGMVIVLKDRALLKFLQETNEPTDGLTVSIRQQQET